MLTRPKLIEPVQIDRIRYSFAPLIFSKCHCVGLVSLQYAGTNVLAVPTAPELFEKTCVLALTSSQIEVLERLVSLATDRFSFVI
jgi:hypothetical protein